MTLRRLFHVLVIGAGALLGGACATSGASGSGDAQRLPDGGVVTPPPPTMQSGGAPSGW